MAAIAEVKVAAGAALLDERHPGWAGELDLNRLLMSHGCTCVLGQLYGHYQDGKEALDLDQDDAEGYGFDITTDEESYADLLGPWLRAAADRRRL